MLLCSEYPLPVRSDQVRVERVVVEPRVWWRSLGGPNAISVWSWIVTTGIAVIISAAYEVPTFDFRLWQRLGLVLITQVALIPVFVVGHVILVRLRTSKPLVGLASFAVIGVARGVVITLLAPSIEPLARPGMVYQVILGVTYALLSLPFIAVVVDALRSHRGLQARVLAAQEGWETALRTTETKFDAEYALYRQRIESDVNARIITLTDELASVAREATTAGAVVAAEELRRLSAQVVRPLSHELILESGPARIAPITFTPPPSLLGLKDVLRDAAKTPTAGHWVVCAALVLLGAVGLAPLATTPLIALNSVWDVVIFGLVPMLVLAVGGRLWSRLSSGAAWLASGVLWVALACLGVTGTAALCYLLTGEAAFYWIAGGFYVLISFGTVIAWTGFRRLRALDEEYVVLLAEQEDQAATVMARLERNRRHLGLVLHGSVQSSLAQAARSLEQWADGMDTDALPDVVAEVRRALDAAMASVDFGPPTGDSLASILRERMALWGESIECVLTVSDDVSDVDDPLLIEQVGDIVGEAVTNAVRHGQADEVSVVVRLSGNALVLLVSDNGLGPGESLPPGGGLGHLMQSGFAWTLEREGNRTVLSVRIPLSRAADGPVLETEQAGVASATRA